MKAANGRGQWVQGVDIRRIPGFTDQRGHSMSEDLDTETGFLNAIALVARIEEGGLLWIATASSSWCWLNFKNTKRSLANGYAGDESYEPARLGNRLAHVTAFLLEFAVARRCNAAMENPLYSWICKYPPLACVLTRAGCNTRPTHGAALGTMPRRGRASPSSTNYMPPMGGFSS